jgi:hypothetical protein
MLPSAMGKFRKSSATKTHIWNGQHRFEHWYRDNTVYFITSKARDARHVFRTDEAKRIFWDRFNHWASKYTFEPWITTLLDNHYHTVGYLKVGENLGPMMQRLHGSVAKLVNDTLDERHLPFWRTKGNRDYFDGCLRDENQLRRTYRYVQQQSVRHGVTRDWRGYPHTVVGVGMEEALATASTRHAYLAAVPYKRYQK